MRLVICLRGRDMSERKNMALTGHQEIKHVKNYVQRTSQEYIQLQVKENSKQVTSTVCA